MTVGEIIQRARKALGLSQSEMAVKLGVTRGAVSQWETDKFVPSYQHAVELAELLKLDGSALSPILALELKSKSAFSTIPLISMSHITDWLKEFHQLPDVRATIPPECYPVNTDISDGSWAVLLEDDSMSPEFNRGDVIVIGLFDLQPSDGEYAVVSFFDGRPAVLRQCVARGKDTLGREVYDLRAANPNFPTITVPLDPNFENPVASCVGVALEHRRRLKEPPPKIFG